MYIESMLLTVHDPSISGLLPQDAEKARSQLVQLRNAKETEKADSDAKLLHLQLTIERLEAQASANANQQLAAGKWGQGEHPQQAPHSEAVGLLVKSSG